MIRSPWIRNQVFKNPNLDHSHLQLAMKSPDSYVRMDAIAHPKSTKEMYGEALNSGIPRIIATALGVKHHTATGEQLTNLLNHPSSDVVSSALEHGLERGTLEPKHIKQILDNPQMTSRKAPISDSIAVQVAEGIKKSPKLLNGLGHEYAAKLNDLGTGSWERTVGSSVGSYSTGDLASIARTHYHRTATVDDIDRALGTNGHQPDSNPVIRGFAITHPKVQQRHVDKVLGMHGAPQDGVEGVRRLALTGEKGYYHNWDLSGWNHPSPNHDHLINSEHIDKVLGANGNTPDAFSIVREAAITHNNATNDHLMKATNDETQTNRQGAINLLKKRGVDVVAHALKDLKQRGILGNRMTESYTPRIKRLSYYRGRMQ
jgi:hypothetical protein